MSDAGKWQVGFWVMSFICTVWLAGLTNSVIANDRMREQGESQILTLVNNHYQDITDRLARIEERQKIQIEMAKKQTD